MKPETVSWAQIDSMADALSKKIRLIPRTFTSITTASRGGLIPSRLLADRLDIDKIHVDRQNIPSDSLFVDDIFDSGKTYEKFLCRARDPSKFVFATLLVRRGQECTAGLIYAKKTKGAGYVVFPWDRLEFERQSS